MNNKQHKVFTSLSRRKRRARALWVKNLIHRERHRCGGIFYDICDIEAVTASGRWSWSDILFTSSDPSIFWNAEIMTTGQHFADLVEEAAFDEAWDMLSDAERDEAAHFETVPNYDASGKVVSRTMVRKPEVKYPQFGGLTKLEYLAKREAEIARDNPPAVHCGYKIMPGFASGIGLRMIVDAECLTVEIIEAAIADFRARGEKEWVAETPSPTPDLKKGSAQLLASLPLTQS